MDIHFFKTLLYRGESETLDFKVDQYAFEHATDDEKSGLLKDLLAFANTFRDSNAYILIGVQEGPNGTAIPLGISRHLDDGQLHSFTDSKTQKPLKFSYERLSFEGKQLGVITIPLQERPLFLQSN